MKIMKWIGAGLLIFTIISHGLGRAQVAADSLSSIAIAPVQTSPPDSIVQITAEAEGLSQVDPSTLPLFASCWWTVYPGTGPVPMPCPPQDLSVPIYEIVDGIYLVDETGGAVSVSIPRTGVMQAETTASVASAVGRQGNAIANLIEQVQATQVQQTMAMAFGMDVPSPGGGSSGGGNYSPDYTPMAAPNYGTNLWIAQTAVATGYLTGIGSNTIADVEYEIQSRTNLLQSDWQSEGFILGSEATNWTPLSVWQAGRQNLFIRLRSWVDSDNVGIPDWWQLEYFGSVGINPFGDPAGDGYNNLYKYAKGLNPTNFLTPPGPSYFVAVLSTNGTNVLLSWTPAQGAVTNHSIVRYVYDDATGNYDPTTVGTVSASASSFSDVGAVQTPDDLYDYYALTADYPGVNTSNTDYADISTEENPPPAPPAAPSYNVSVSANLIRNATGRSRRLTS